MAQTSFINPSNTITQSGVTNANNGWTDNGAYATSNSSSAYVRYNGFSFGLPASYIITGIEVVLNAKESATGDDWEFDVAVSNNGGTSWSSLKTTSEPGTSDTDLNLGGSADVWGVSWTGVNMNSSFAIDVQWGSGATNAGNLSLDAVSVRLTYTELANTNDERNLKTNGISTSNSSRSSKQYGGFSNSISDSFDTTDNKDAGNTTATWTGDGEVRIE